MGEKEDAETVCKPFLFGFSTTYYYMPAHSASADQAFDCDVLIIGGGPGGTTAAAQLAQAGHRVVLADKDNHPRFHIGESLLPANLPLFDELGVGDEIKSIGMYKPGVEFVSPAHDFRKQQFYFANAWDKTMPSAYQVRRSEFDHILLKNAAAKGCTVHEGCRVTSVDFGQNGGATTVKAKHDDGTEQQWTTRYVIDASGRDTFLANKFKLKAKNPKHNSAAIYTHFSGAGRSEGDDEGNITVYWFDHGWFWYIPLQNGVTSVGMVTWPYHFKSRGDRDQEAFFMDNVATVPPLAERLKNATRVHPMEAAANFSYSSSACHGPGYLMVGDAFTFIDPVFSSGVLLAMRGGEAAAKCLDHCLKSPAAEAAAFAEFERTSRKGPKHFSWFIYRMTNPIMRDLFMGPRNVFRSEEALLSLLAGDLYGKTPIWNSLRFLKFIYYMNSVSQLPRAIRAWKNRQRNIRSVESNAAAR